MTTLQVERATGRLPAWAPVGCAGLMTVAIGCCLWVSAHIDADRTVHAAALFAHLASLVLGFGAVLSVDWVALLWLLRLRDLADLLRAARNAHLPIWLGYAGLVTSGILLEPDLSSTATRVKLALVLLIGWNGVVATVLQAPLSISPGGSPTRRLLLISGTTAAVSQLGWWGAMAIGFANGR